MRAPFAARDPCRHGVGTPRGCRWVVSMGADPERAREGLALISALFPIERMIAETPRKKREAVRWAKSRPTVDRVCSWCDALVERVIDDTPIAQALRYGRNQCALSRFLDDGRLPLHN